MMGQDISEKVVARVAKNLHRFVREDTGTPAVWSVEGNMLTALRARVTELEAALATIIDGDVPRPIGEYWFPDHKPSKHDKCTHGVWMYEDCGNCIAEFAIRARSEGEKPQATDGGMG